MAPDPIIIFFKISLYKEGRKTPVENCKKVEKSTQNVATQCVLQWLASSSPIGSGARIHSPASLLQKGEIVANHNKHVPPCA